jgi:hypothetical protein
MNYFVLSGLALAVAAIGEANRETRSDAVSLTLFTFESSDEEAWQVVNDGVMGGRSRGYVKIEDGMLRFTGTLVTQGGGFTSVRARRSVDLSDYEGLELRVRGGGRTFEVEIDDGTRNWGRKVSRRAAFETSDEWAWVRVPFSALQSTVFGRPVRAAAVNLANVRGVGLYILDGIDGPFRLEVEEIRAYQEVRN